MTQPNKPNISILDTRIVYGARCTWWGGIRDIGHIPGTGSEINQKGLPCCPHCGNVLFEMENEGQWWAGVDRYAETHPGYREMMEWARGKCFPNMPALEKAYAERNHQ